MDSRSLSFIGLLIYASVIFHKSRKGTLGKGSYAPTSDAGQQLFSMETGYGAPNAQPYGQNYPDTGYYNRKMDSDNMSSVPDTQPAEHSYADRSYDHQHHVSQGPPNTSAIV